MPHLPAALQRCLDECLRCHGVCLSMATHHCLEIGGRHTEPGHFKLMLACAEICRSAAAMMLIGTDHHRRVCAACAEICLDCARGCEAVGDMDDCIAACRRCAESCREMAA
jgi:hypothetical protein